MNDMLIKFLTGNSVLLITLLLLILFLIILIYIVGFIQGRELSFWPPKIGSKPLQVEGYDPRENSQPSDRAGDDRIPLGLEALMESSNLPMFFTDINRKVLRCNTPLIQLLDSSQEVFENKDIWFLLNRLIELAPKDRQIDFRKRQQDRQEKYSKNQHPNSDDSDDSEYLDTSNHAATNMWRGKFKIWIHADRVKLDGREIGYFVIYHFEKVNKIPASQS